MQQSPASLGNGSKGYMQFPRKVKRDLTPTPNFEEASGTHIDGTRGMSKSASQPKKRVKKHIDQASVDAEDQIEFLERRAARREREDEEMYVGLKNFNGSQRGWNGKPEAERRQEEEQRRIESRVKTPPPFQGLDPYPRSVSARELEASFEAHLSREYMKQLAAEDLVTIQKERNQNEMMKAKWDLDAIKQAAIEEQYDREKNRTRPTRQRRKDSDAGIETVEPVEAIEGEEESNTDEESASTSPTPSMLNDSASDPPENLKRDSLDGNGHIELGLTENQQDALTSLLKSEQTARELDQIYEEIMEHVPDGDDPKNLIRYGIEDYLSIRIGQ